MSILKDLISLIMTSGVKGVPILTGISLVTNMNARFVQLLKYFGQNLLIWSAKIQQNLSFYVNSRVRQKFLKTPLP